MNVLISSVGRRVGLIGCFRQSLAELGQESTVAGIDASSTAPGFHLCDKAWLVRRCTEPQFTGEVLSLALREQIGLIVPTIDTELPVYARTRTEFATSGVTLSVSSEEVVKICADKRLTNAWFVASGFPTVRQGRVSEVLAQGSDWRLPLIVKPRLGSASVGVRRIASRAEMAMFVGLDDELVVEEVAPGIEHTVNLYVDRRGICRCAVPHHRIEVRSGEVSKAVTVKNRPLMEVARRVVERLPGAYGPLNLQCFVTNAGEIRCIEINARFGGGYPLAHRAGAPFTRWLMEETSGKEPSWAFDEWQDDLAMLRFDEAIYLPGREIREGLYTSALLSV